MAQGGTRPPGKCNAASWYSCHDWLSPHTTIPAWTATHKLLKLTQPQKVGKLEHISHRTAFIPRACAPLPSSGDDRQSSVKDSKGDGEGGKDGEQGDLYWDAGGTAGVAAPAVASMHIRHLPTESWKRREANLDDVTVPA